MTGGWLVIGGGFTGPRVMIGGRCVGAGLGGVGAFDVLGGAGLGGAGLGDAGVTG